MKLAAVVVLYEPEKIGIEKIFSNLESYCSYCEKIYLVDNSAKEHDFNNKNFNLVYIFNQNKGGIAGAQNKGCEQAMKDGFEWVMTMDQDSYFDKKEIKNYINLVEQFIKKDESASSFAPHILAVNKRVFWTKQIRFKILSPLKRKILGKRYCPNKVKEIEQKERVIASGNIINLMSWKMVKGFDEYLFISEVDYDFCYKLRKINKKIIMFNTVYLKQYFGETQPFTLLKKYHPKYSDIRLYYTFRNAFIEKKRFPEYKSFYNNLIKEFYWDNCINSIHFIKNRRIFKKAKKDYLQYIKDFSKP